MYEIFFQPVQKIIPIKEATEKALTRIGIVNLRDLVFYLPNSYNIKNTSSNLSSLKDGELIQAKVKIIEVNHPTKKRQPMKIYAENETGGLLLVFFNKMPPFIYNKMQIGSSHIVIGKVQKLDGSYQITHPEFVFKKIMEDPLEPVYPLTYGINNRQLYSYILEGLRALEISIITRKNFSKTESQDNSEDLFHNEYLFMQSLYENLKKIHLVGMKPDRTLIDQQVSKSLLALSAKELFANQVFLAHIKDQEQKSKGISFKINQDFKANILKNLSFQLTNAQANAIEEIEKDMQSDSQMVRLLQGDVGSGKTLIALICAIHAVNSGKQVAIMAPTDLLSSQHYSFFTKALEETKINSSLLTGKTKLSERKKIMSKLESGEISILIGTHALFQDSVELQNLGLVIIDEQHRFGVNQRKELVEKGNHPDLLVMTATPIPRSLALTLFGDMSVSFLKEKPKNRQLIITKTFAISKKDELISSLENIIARGEQVFWVCPLIDKSDKSLDEEASSEIPEDNFDKLIYADATTVYQEISQIYGKQVALLHGKMKSVEKDETMNKFKNGEYKILIATTVVEVGIDVPQASVIIIENAEKFGLAQLHQLRGRVGRSSLQSYCFLLYNPKAFSKIARKRLSIMRESNDGFFLAERDLQLRGGGEILGTKQSGMPEFFFADLMRDINLLTRANEYAKNFKIDDFTKFQIKLFSKITNEDMGTV